MITSCANTKVKRIVSLQEKSRNRVKENVFIAEGIKMFEEGFPICLQDKLHTVLSRISTKTYNNISCGYNF